MNTTIDASSMEWVFKKNCSFTPRQVGLFYIAQSTLSLLIAGFFLLQGIWIVITFTIAELVILATALLIYARHATDYERIILKQGELLIETSLAGKVMQYVYNPRWVRLERLLNPNKLIAVAYQDKKIEIGRFMHISLRQGFIKDFARALSKNY